jgi:hypothetical protein
MNANKIITIEVSEVLTEIDFTGSTRNSPTLEPVKELVDFVEAWVAEKFKIE